MLIDYAGTARFHLTLRYPVVQSSFELLVIQFGQQCSHFLRVICLDDLVH